jgi:hypothetical protein
VEQPKKIQPFDIFYFHHKLSEKPMGSSYLKHFINFLNDCQVPKPYKFTFVSRDGALIPNLSLKENIFLESVPTSLTTSKECQFEQYLNQSGHHHLPLLLHALGDLDKKPPALTKQQVKLASLIIGILKPNKYLFLETPEFHLVDQKLLQLVKQALVEQSKRQTAPIFIASEAMDFWSDFSNKIVHQSPNGQLTVKERIKTHLPQEVADDGIRFINFSKSKSAA